MRSAIFGLLAASLLAAPATAQRAGTLISADPVVDTPGGMQAWRIQHWTQTDRNRAIRATGGSPTALPDEPRRATAGGSSG